MQLETEQVQPLQMAPPTHRRIRRKQLRIGILFMAPAFLVIAIFMLGPAFWSIYISGTNTSLTGVGAAAPQWVGVQNFVQILHDAEFFNAFRVSLTYLVGSALIGQAVLGLLLAMLMRRRQRAFKAVLGGIIAADLLIINLATLSDFTLVYVLTGGANPNAELLTIYQYNVAFKFYEIGYGSAISLLILVVGAILGLLYIRVLRIDL